MKKYISYKNVWFVSFTIIGVILSLIWGESLIGFTAFITGIICVLCAATGNRHTFSIGIINATTYAWVAYNSQLYGETILNAGFYLPLQFIGWYMWSKKLKQGNEVCMQALTKKAIAILIPVSISLVFICGFGLSQFRSQAIPYTDAFTTVFSIIASILMLLRYREFWFLYIAVNVVSVAMWTHRAVNGVDDSITMIVMWSAYLVNSVYGLITWYRGTRND